MTGITEGGTTHTPDYCPDDGTELTTERDGFAIRTDCPECGERWYGTLFSWLLWKVPPQARPILEKPFAWWFQRPRVTPLATMGRLFSLLAVILSVGSVLPDPAGSISFLTAVALFFIAIENIPDLGSGGKQRFKANDVIIALGGCGAIATQTGVESIVVSITSIQIAFNTPAVGTAANVGGLVLLFLAVYHATGQIVIRAHEYLHKLAYAYFNIEADIEYRKVSFGPVPLGIRGGTTIPRPSSWKGEEWEELLVSLAPMILLVPLAIGIALALTVFDGVIAGMSLPGEVILSSIGTTVLVGAFPSGGDVGSASHASRKLMTEATSSEAHRIVEGVETN